MNKNQLTFAIFFAFFCFSNLLAQNKTNVLPKSFDFASSRNSIPSQYTPTINRDSLVSHTPVEVFAIPSNVHINLKEQGLQTNTPEGIIYQLEIDAKNSLSTAACYENFKIAKGGLLHLYSRDKSQIVGAYTEDNNPVSGKFITDFIHDDSFIIEYFEPHGVHNGNIVINRIYASIRPEPLAESRTAPTPTVPSTEFNNSQDCHENINCSTDSTHLSAKNSVVRILITNEENMIWCSGSVLNNINEDKKPFILTAFHCHGNYTPIFDLWRFDFNYQTPDCNNVTTAPEYESIIGCTFKSGYEDTDFTLLELSSTIPRRLNVRYSGWNASPNTDHQKGFTVHHPNSDVKKISTFKDAPLKYPNGITWDIGVRTPPFHHWQGIFQTGSFQGGSSGGPLFNENGEVIGQMHGGNGKCADNPENLNEIETFYGRFDISWEGGGTPETRLKDHLDPNNTNTLQIGAIQETATYNINGQISFGDTFLKNVKVDLIDSEDNTLLQTISSDEDGNFSFNDITAQQNYTLSLSHEADFNQSVSVSDLVLLNGYIFNESALSLADSLATDANRDQRFTVSDAVILRQFINDIRDGFTHNSVWLFYDKSNFIHSGQAFEPRFNINLDGDKTLEIGAIKIGDTNFSFRN